MPIDYDGLAGWQISWQHSGQETCNLCQETGYPRSPNPPGSPWLPGFPGFLSLPGFSGFFGLCRFLGFLSFIGFLILTNFGLVGAWPQTSGSLDNVDVLIASAFNTRKVKGT